MSYGSNGAVEEAEAAYREQSAQAVARAAAELVAARDMGRNEAISEVVEWLRNEQAAENDPTGVAAAENVALLPSKESPNAQVAAIAAELLEAARDAVDGM